MDRRHHFIPDLGFIEKGDIVTDRNRGRTLIRALSDSVLPMGVPLLSAKELDCHVTTSTHC